MSLELTFEKSEAETNDTAEKNTGAYDYKTNMTDRNTVRLFPLCVLMDHCSRASIKLMPDYRSIDPSQSEEISVLLRLFQNEPVVVHLSVKMDTNLMETADLANAN